MTEPITVEQMYGPPSLPEDEIQAVLDRSLSPRAADSLYDNLESLGIGAGHLVLDIGGRDGRHALELATRLGCKVIAIDPVAANLERGRVRVAGHEFGRLVELRHGTIERIPLDDASVDLVFSRDMVNHIVEIDKALAECHRVLLPGGAMVIYQTFAGPRLEPREAAEIFESLATVPERMDPAGFERAVVAAGFEIESCDVVSSEWREAWEEDGSRRTSSQLLHAARLIRAGEALRTELGEVDYRVELANALWGVYQMIGKLEPRIYTLRRA